MINIDLDVYFLFMKQRRGTQKIKLAVITIEGENIHNSMENLLPVYLKTKMKWQFSRKIKILKMIKDEKLNIQVLI